MAEAGVWNKRVLPVTMQWSYGDPKRGRSTEDMFFVQNMAGLVDVVEPVWIDELLQAPARTAELVKERVKETRPDLLFFVPFRDEIDHDLLAWCRDRKIPTVAWFSDDDWRFDSYARFQAPHYSHVVTTAKLKVDRYREELGIDPLLLHWAGQLRGPARAPLKVTAGDTFRHEVSFVGQTEPYRRWLLKRLRREGIKVADYGWGSSGGVVSFEEMEDIFRSSVISLNIANSAQPDIRYVLGAPMHVVHYLRSPKRSEQLKGRNCEIPLAGGFQLTNYVVGLEDYFDIGREVAAYTTPDDLVEQIRYYLRHPELRDAIADAGHERAVREHTYRHRLVDVFTAVFGAPPGGRTSVASHETISSSSE